MTVEVAMRWLAVLFLAGCGGSEWADCPPGGSVDIDANPASVVVWECLPEATDVDTECTVTEAWDPGAVGIVVSCAPGSVIYAEW